ncbi:MAG: lipid A deacylase LpxR family protein [Psychromonas sp.]|nr:lipid A deacylase LpxR family protein [Psychromonas sp.]
MKKRSFCCVLIFCILSNVVFATSRDEGQSKQNVKLVLAKVPSFQYVGVTLENDAFLRDDAIYTNGTFAFWGDHDIKTLDDTTLPTWIAFLTQYTQLANKPNKLHDISYTIGQIIQTPVNFVSSEIIKHDVPFVGLLGWNARLQSFDNVTDDQIGLTLGAVGPIVGGEFSQRMMHSILGSPSPKGWDNQIDNEVIVRLDTLRKWRFYEKSFHYTQIDFITGGGGGVGNLKSDLSVGLTARWGTSLQKSFDIAPIFATQQFNSLSPSPSGWYFFTNITGSYVFNDIFIDGNTFQDSHSVDLINDQFALSFGGMFNIHHWNFIYTEVFLSDQYKTQVEMSRFGAVSLSYKF